MRTDRTETRQKWQEWLCCDAGAAFLKKEQEVLDEILPNLFGYQLLQVGDVGDVDLLARSRIPHRMVVGLEDIHTFPGYPRLRGTAHALPVTTDSIDILILPHVLEFSDAPQEVLREVDRVLVPEGHLLVFAFDPWCLSGATQLRAFGRNTAPWRGDPPGVGRLRGWLGTLGFDILEVMRFPSSSSCRDTGKTYNSPLFFANIPATALWAMSAWRTFIAGAYFLVAKKRVTTLTLIGPRFWRRQPERDLAAVGMGKISGFTPSPDLAHEKPGIPGRNTP